MDKSPLLHTYIHLPGHHPTPQCFKTGVEISAVRGNFTRYAGRRSHSDMHFAYAILRLQLTRVCLGSSASAYTFARRASMVSSSRTHLAVVLWCLGPLGMPPYLRDPGAAGGTRFDLIMQGSTGCKLSASWEALHMSAFAPSLRNTVGGRIHRDGGFVLGSGRRAIRGRGRQVA